MLDHLVIQRLGNKSLPNNVPGTQNKGNIFNKNELAAILKFGAEELFKEDKEEEREDKEDKEFTETIDIDEILARADTVPFGEHAEPEGDVDLLNSFKVADFSLKEEEEEEEEEKDPDFWEKIIPEDEREKASAQNSKGDVSLTNLDFCEFKLNLISDSGLSATASQASQILRWVRQGWWRI